MKICRVWLLPPANEVWGKVICLQVCVCPQGGVCSRGGAWWTPPPTATAAGGTHPTGMNEFFNCACSRNFAAQKWISVDIAFPIHLKIKLILGFKLKVHFQHANIEFSQDTVICFLFSNSSILLWKCLIVRYYKCVQITCKTSKFPPQQCCSLKINTHARARARLKLLPVSMVTQKVKIRGICAVTCVSICIS